MQFEQYTEAEIFIIKVSNKHISVFIQIKNSVWKEKKKTQYEKKFFPPVNNYKVYTVSNFNTITSNLNIANS